MVNKDEDDQAGKEPFEDDENAPVRALDEGDIALLKTYGTGPYNALLKELERDIEEVKEEVKFLVGVRESDTGLTNPSHWDLVADKQMMADEEPLQVARCTKILDADTEAPKYCINIRHVARFVVGLGDTVSPVDEGMRVGIDRGSKYCINMALPPRIDPLVSVMEVEEKPDVTYDDIGGCNESMDQLREVVVELPLLHPERFVRLGIDPPRGVLLYGLPGTGKTLAARAVANRTDACFIRVIGSELVQKVV
ncbi:unnamed protein product, partial [Discosporangium mesarthrocarpum]